MNTTADLQFKIVMASIIITIVFTIGMIVGSEKSEYMFFTKGLQQGIKSYQIEAVQQGVGEWIVADDGTTTFKWLKNEQ
jgi:hypothetical protein